MHASCTYYVNKTKQVISSQLFLRFYETTLFSKFNLINKKVENFIHFHKNNPSSQATPVKPNCLATQSIYLSTLAYTPYVPGSAHPYPQEVIPIRLYPAWLDDWLTKGPPLSPWQLSVPLAPAQIIPLVIVPLPMALSHLLLDTGTTLVFSRTGANPELTDPTQGIVIISVVPQLVTKVWELPAYFSPSQFRILGFRRPLGAKA